MTLAISKVGIPGYHALQNPPRPPRTTCRALTLRAGLNRSSLFVRHASVVSNCSAAAGDALPHTALGERLPSTFSSGHAFDRVFVLNVLSQKSRPSNEAAGANGHEDTRIAQFNDPSWKPPTADDFAGLFLRAFQQADVWTLWNLTRCLDSAGERAGLGRRQVPQEVQTQLRALGDVVFSLPVAAFSELLRLLEPDSVHRHLHGNEDRLYVSAGMAAATPLGSLVDEFGRRRRHLALYRRLVMLCRTRREAGHPLMASDYKILLRSAGTTMVRSNVKTIWSHYQKATIHVKSSDVATEFIKARFFTEPASYQYDLDMLRVRPLNLHSRKIKLDQSQYRRLEAVLKRAVRTRHDRFGQSPKATDNAQPFSRLVMSIAPIRRLLAHNRNQGLLLDEAQACANLIALSRTNSIRECNRILSIWGISVKVRRGTSFPIQVTADPAVLRRWHMGSQGSLTAPTPRLFRSVIYSYCCMGEVLLGLEIVETLSRIYGIPIPNDIWNDLLEWTHIYSGYPARYEWEIVQPLLSAKPVHEVSVLQIWEIMTSTPYNVQPDVTHYYVMAKNLIMRGETVVAVELMEKMVAEYDQRLRELESAAVEGAHAASLGLDTSRSTQRYHAALLDKWLVWFYIHHCCRQLLRAIRRDMGPEANAWASAAVIPDYVAAFERFMPRDIKYKGATGLITLNLERNLGSQNYKLDRETIHLPPYVPFGSAYWADCEVELPDYAIKKRKKRRKAGPPRIVTRDVFPANLDSTFFVPANRKGLINLRWVEREFA